MTKYNKLVRDLIPDIIRAKGTEPKFRLAAQEEYVTKLREKLQEEVNEYLESGSSEELADIQEVVHALGALAGHGIWKTFGQKRPPNAAGSRSA